MKNQKMWKCLVIGLCMSALTGCGAGENEKTGGGDMNVSEYQSSLSDDADMHSDDNIAPKADHADGSVSQENKDSSLPDGNAADASQENQNNTTVNGTDEKVDHAGGSVSQENKDSSLPDGNAADASQENQNNSTINGTDDKVDADSLYASAAMTGSVVDFSDGSCTVSATITEDDGITGVIAAPGYESEDTNVVVTYQEGCVVQIATIYTSTGIAELEQASVADIKKQASVIIYGSFEDTHHVTAAKIIICHRTA